MTERKIEQLLESETRWLPMPDGRSQPHTASQALWQAVDELTAPPIRVPLNELVGRALEVERINARPFAECFHNSIAYAHAVLAPPWSPRYLPRWSPASRHGDG